MTIKYWPDELNKPDVNASIKYTHGTDEVNFECAVDKGCTISNYVKPTPWTRDYPEASGFDFANRTFFPYGKFAFAIGNSAGKLLTPYSEWFEVRDTYRNVTITSGDVDVKEGDLLHAMFTFDTGISLV